MAKCKEKNKGMAKGKTKNKGMEKKKGTAEGEAQQNKRHSGRQGKKYKGMMKCKEKNKGTAKACQKCLPCLFILHRFIVVPVLMC